MNKNISISIVVAGLLFFAGCGNSNSKDDSTQNDQSSAFEVQQQSQNLTTFEEGDDTESNVTNDINATPISHCKKYTILKDENISDELNATDADGDILTYSIEKNPKHGILEDFNATSGKFIYIPDNNYVGCDYFKFKATDGNSDSNISKIVIKIKEPQVQKPAAPSSLSASELNSTKVTLTWNDNSDNETKFIIYQDGKKVAEVDENVTTVQIEDLDAGKSYEFCVKAANEAGCSCGDKTTVTTPNETTAPLAPSDLELVKKNSSCIKLKWKDNSENEDGFRVYDENQNIVKELPKNCQCATIKDLDPNTLYKFSVKSYNDVAESNVSTNELEVTTDELDSTNSAPVAYDKTFCTKKDTPISKKLPVCDKENDKLTYNLVEDVKHGSLEYNSTSNILTYTPEQSYVGCDSFKYSVSDDQNNTSEIKTITIKIK